MDRCDHTGWMMTTLDDGQIQNLFPDTHSPVKFSFLVEGSSKSIREGQNRTAIIGGTKEKIQGKRGEGRK